MLTRICSFFQRQIFHWLSTGLKKLNVELKPNQELCKMFSETFSNGQPVQVGTSLFVKGFVLKTSKGLKDFCLNDRKTSGERNQSLIIVEI